MGYVEIMRPDGTYTKLTGGKIVTEDRTFFCDSCEQLKPVSGSEITSADGLDLLQLCSECKKYPKRAAK